jgi:hypothetical protein
MNAIYYICNISLNRLIQTKNRYSDLFLFFFNLIYLRSVGYEYETLFDGSDGGSDADGFGGGGAGSYDF